MKAIQVKQAGDARVLQLQDVPQPPYGEEDGLIQMKVAGINFIDIYLRNGLYKAPHFPFTPGKEGSGVVFAVGKNVQDLKVGDRVAFCAGGSGSYAEFVAIAAAQVVKIPDGVSFEEAAAMMLQGLTAYYLCYLTYPLQAYQTALIHAGAGGVGTLLIQMAKAIKATVITTVSTEEKAKLATAMGADHVILYTRESTQTNVLKFTNNKGVNVVYDSVGKTTFEESLHSLAIRGMLVSYGQSSGRIPPFEMAALAEKSLYLTRPSLANYTKTREEFTQMADAVFAMVAQEKLKITIGQRYPLAEAAKAHADLESRATIGKSILTIPHKSD